MNETKTEALAVTRSESRIDKSEWGGGPWDDEPDLIEWQSDSAPSFWCQINRTEATGCLCGYVAVPQDHPVHGHGFSEVDALVEVHGGLTFGGPGVAGLWVFGFDCGHGFDVHPAMEARLKATMPREMYAEHQRVLTSESPGMPRTTYKTLSYVRAEVESLARQLAAMGPAALTEGAAVEQPQVSVREPLMLVAPPEKPEGSEDVLADLSLREVAFYEALLRYDIGNASGSEFLSTAVLGFTMREHVREEHAGREEECSHAAPPDEPQRGWWLFGYNFEEPGTVAQQLEAEA